MVQPSFGVVVEHIGSSLSMWRERIRKIEDLGYNAILFPDHIDYAGVTDFGPIAAMGSAISLSRTLQFWSFVFNNDVRNPVALAKEVATLNMLSDGRVVFGLGSGYLEDDYRQCGIRLDPAGIRIDRFEEALHIIKKVFKGDGVSFSGKHYSIEAEGPHLAQKSCPPIYIGGGGQRVLSIAAREADIIGLAPRNTKYGIDLQSATAEATAQKVEWIRAAAGNRFSQLTLSCMLFHVNITEQKPEEAAERAKNFFQQRFKQELSIQEILGSPHLLIGSEEAICEALLKAQQMYNVSSFSVLEKDMDTFGRIIACFDEQKAA